MDKSDVEQLIIKTYEAKYSEWKSIEVKDYVEGYQGIVAVVSAKGEVCSYDNEEICYVNSDGTVKIFDTTVELLNFLHRKAQPLLLERLTARSVVASFVFVGVLTGLFALILFKEKIDPQALACLTSLVGVAAGFFFGSTKAGN